jgi:hypothetical protein
MTTLDLNRKENHYVKATLTSENSEIRDVPCKIFLPERIFEKPYLLFKPQKRADEAMLMSFHAAKFKALIFGFNKELQSTIEAEQVYFSQSGTTYWGDDLSESTAFGEPQHLHVISHRDNSGAPDKTEMTFWISPNQLLQPSAIRTTSYTGEIRYKYAKKVQFVIKNGVKLVFEEHFRTKITEDGDLLQWSYLVANAELQTPATDLETLIGDVLPDLDDFLLIASFAAGRRTACLGWTATDKHAHATYYRGNYTFPDCKEKGDIHERLADFKSYKKFIDVCYSNFLAHENQLALRSAICSAVPLNHHTLESSFLSQFSALETLLLDYRRQNELEFVLEKNKWKDLKGHLQKCIKASNEPKLEHEQRKSIYSKLDELNRISIRDAFNTFSQSCEIHLADLWPVFGDEEAIGLVDVRNKLIHGDPFPPDLIGALSMAQMHLKIVLDRMLVRVLGWNITETKVGPASCSVEYPSLKNFSEDRTQLSKYIRSQAV